MKRGSQYFLAFFVFRDIINYDLYPRVNDEK